MAQATPEAGLPKYYTEPTKVDVQGLPTAYREKGSGKTVLFLHGAGLTRMWLPFYDMMSERSRFLAPEHPGFGDTPFPDWLRGFDDMVIHYDEFLAKLDIDKFHLVGFSVGGWLAAELASYFPRRVESLTLINPIGLRVDWPVEDDVFAIGPEEATKRLLNNPEAAKDLGLMEPPSPEAIVQGYGEASTLARLAWTPRYSLKLERRLGRITCPSLVAVGDNDRLIPDSIGRRYAELLPNSRLESVSGGGHALFAEQPKQSAALINEFIEESVQ